MTYTATLAPDNTAFTVNHGETILTAARRQGLNLPHSCQSGICGQCKAEVLSGHFLQRSHAEQALPREELAQNKILTCCCEATSDIQLKIPNFNGSKVPPVKTLPARIAQIEYRGDTAILILDLPKAPPFQFLAGQYIELLFKDGQIRCYSIANSPSQNHYLELHIRKREQGYFSKMLFAENPLIQPKMVLRLRGPYGIFALQLNENPIILLATGTGYAPIQSILQHLKDQQSTRPIHLYWGARVEQDLYYLNEAQALIQSLPNASFTAVLSRPSDNWQGKTGYVQQIVLQDFPDMKNCEVYACGSAQMTLDAKALFINQAQLPAQAFFSDAFTPA